MHRTKALRKKEPFLRESHVATVPDWVNEKPDQAVCHRQKGKRTNSIPPEAFWHWA
jgi:hypothetical protein